MRTCGRPLIGPARHGRGTGARAGQAFVETALVLTSLLLALFGLLAVHTIIDARLQVETLARETARVMGEAASYEQALAAGNGRFQAVAAGLTLEPARLSVTHAADPGFARGSLVSVTVTYRLPLAGLPLDLGDQTITATARQPVQLYGSRRQGR